MKKNLDQDDSDPLDGVVSSDEVFVLPGAGGDEF